MPKSWILIPTHCTHANDVHVNDLCFAISFRSNIIRPVCPAARVAVSLAGHTHFQGHHTSLEVGVARETRWPYKSNTSATIQLQTDQVFSWSLLQLVYPVIVTMILASSTRLSLKQLLLVAAAMLCCHGSHTPPESEECMESMWSCPACFLADTPAEYLDYSLNVSALHVPGHEQDITGKLIIALCFHAWIE